MQFGAPCRAISIPEGPDLPACDARAGFIFAAPGAPEPVHCRLVLSRGRAGLLFSPDGELMVRDYTCHVNTGSEGALPDDN